jgi:hypothetical protein
MRNRRILGLLTAVVGGLLLGACSTSTPSTSPSTQASTATTPSYTHASVVAPHIMVIVMENQSYDLVTGNSEAPYMDSLARGYLRATNSFGHAHDSLPNYIEMISGNGYEASGTQKDCAPSDCGPISGTDIADQLDAAGISWKAFLGAMPSDCDTSDAGGSGGYGVRHNPFVYFSQGRSGAECANDVPATGLLPALNSSTPPDFVYYSPTICENGGNDVPCSTIANGDRFLAKTIPAIMGTSWYRDHGTIILTWDESATSDTSGSYGDNGGHILTLVISAKTKGDGGNPYPGYVDPAGILRSVEHAYGFGYLADARNSALALLPLTAKAQAAVQG